MGVVQGSGVDASLNETGVNQAMAFFKKYRAVNFDKIYISTLKRTYQTIEPFIDKGIPYEKLPGLNEINWGEKEGIKISEADNTYYKEVIRKWQEGTVDLAISGGESPMDVFKRQQQAFEVMFPKPEENTILICMHGRAMRIFLCLLLNYEIKSMDMFGHANVCLYKLSYTGNLFTIERYNDLSHLEGLEEFN